MTHYLIMSRCPLFGFVKEKKVVFKDITLFQL